MDKAGINKRLQELGIYNDYYYRKELKALPQLLKEGEQINCLLTGVYAANRRMVAVTNNRIVIIFIPTLGPAEVTSIGLGAVTGYTFTKKFFFSKLEIEAGKTRYEFTGVQGARKDLFEWAMKQ